MGIIKIRDRGDPSQSQSTSVSPIHDICTDYRNILIRLFYPRRHPVNRIDFGTWTSSNSNSMNEWRSTVEFRLSLRTQRNEPPQYCGSTLPKPGSTSPIAIRKRQFLRGSVPVHLRPTLFGSLKPGKSICSSSRGQLRHMSMISTRC